MTEHLNKRMRTESSSWQAEKVAGNDDLLREILSRLPGTSLLRFRCVCRHWRLIISSPDLRQLQSCRSTCISTGLFLFRKSNRRYHLDHHVNFSFSGVAKNRVPCNIRTFIESFRSVEPIHYCNGLLCLKLCLDNDEVFYCVYNHCTNRYTNIPKPDIDDDHDDEIVAMNLAFDPSKSSNYKIVCVVKGRLGLLRFLTFCAESTWKESGQEVRVRGEYSYYFGKGVFSNGAIHLVSKSEPFLCFDVDNECLKVMPSTSIHEGHNRRKIKYFGESNGKLHLIEENVLRPTLLNVFELEKDYSKWFVKYVVDVDDLSRLFPLMSFNEPEFLEVVGYQFDVLCFLDGEKEGKTMLVLSLPGKVISYDINNMNVKELLNVQLEELHLNMEDYLVYNYKWYHAYKHIETLALV
ncbi:F-box protein like [Capsicum chacoense]|nr:hypothetical protein FXO37_23743 [Capsicum annuum]KAF3654036.1 hypothetical protein FXO38_15332 [Capsicum annuum]